MTTVQDLLDTATKYCFLSLDEVSGVGPWQPKLAAQYAAIAQAHAATAQAMILAQMTSEGTDINGTFSRWLRADTGN
jgi:hypothetical protein